MAGKSAILSVRILGDASGATKAIGAVDTGLEKSARNASKFGDILGKAGVTAGAALTKGLIDAVDADGATRKLGAQLGLSGAEAEAAGRIAGSLYSDAYGESLEHVSGAVAAVGSTLADVSANGGADVERLAGKALDLAGTFGVEVSEAVSTAGALMKNGLAKDGDEAFDLLVGSLQKMPAAMQAELFPVLDEYSKHFADLGIDGTTALGMLQVASEDGAIGMDKLGDSLKELTIRATDGSAGTIAAYDAMGLSADEMTAKMLEGGPAANEAFGQIVAGLQGIDDPAAQAQAAIALFGTPLEDLGTAGIPNFLGAIDPMGDAFDSVAGSADKLSEAVNTGPGVAFEEMKRSVLGSLQETAAAALPVLTPILDLLTRFAPIIGPLAVGIAAVAGIVKVVAAAQWAWNAALAANPITLVIILIAALVAGIVWAYNNVGWFKDAVDAMGAAAVIVWDAIVAAVQGVIGWLDDLLEPIGGIDGAINVLKETAEAVFGGINSAIEGTIGWVKDAIGWFQSLFGAKNDAAAAGGDAGAADAAAAAAPAAAMLSAAPMVASAQLMAAPSLTAAPSPANLTRSIGALSQRSAGPTVNHTTKVEVTFKGLTTDKVGVAREIRKLLRDEAALVGAS